MQRGERNKNWMESIVNYIEIDIRDLGAVCGEKLGSSSRMGSARRRKFVTQSQWTSLGLLSPPNSNILCWLFIKKSVVYAHQQFAYKAFFLCSPERGLLFKIIRNESLNFCDANSHFWATLGENRETRIFWHSLVREIYHNKRRDLKGYTCTGQECLKHEKIEYELCCTWMKSDFVKREIFVESFMCGFGKSLCEISEWKLAFLSNLRANWNFAEISHLVDWECD